MWGLIEMEQNGCEWIIHNHDPDHSFNMVGYMNVPDSDWMTSDIHVPSSHLVKLVLSIMPVTGSTLST